MLEGRKMAKSSSFEKNAVKKGAWSEEEDEKLRAYIQRYGHWNWALLPKFAGLSRSGKSCRLRWMNYLRPNMKHGNFTKQEDDTIIKLHKKLGNKWSAIAANMPGRSDNEIKNRWNTHLKKRAHDNDTALESGHIEIMEPNLGNPEGSPDPKLQNEGATSSEPTPTELPSCSSMVNDEFWTEPFLQDITSSFDVVLSPLNVVDYLISQTSYEDMMMMNDEFSWLI